ncbi:MAG: DUF4296 domain-containing protein [Bacteroidaceae bacterium]
MRPRSERTLLAWMVGLALLVAGCRQGVPDEVVQPAAMEDLLYDFHLAKAMSGELPFAERYRQHQYYAYVLEKHHVSRAEFDSSLVWYTRHTDELSKIYVNLGLRFKREQARVDHLIAIRDNKPRESAPGDSVDVWTGNRLYALSQGSPLLNQFSFEVPADAHFLPGDRFVWYWRASFLPLFEMPTDTAWMMLSARTESDSVFAVRRRVCASGADSLTLACDSGVRPKSLSGYVYYPGRGGGEGLLLDSIRLMRYRRAAEADTARVVLPADTARVRREGPVRPARKDSLPR